MIYNHKQPTPSSLSVSAL